MNASLNVSILELFDFDKIEHITKVSDRATSVCLFTNFKMPHNTSQDLAGVCQLYFNFSVKMLNLFFVSYT